MSSLRRFFAGTAQINPMEAATEKAKQLINDNPVMVFSKSWCSYSRSAKRTLDNVNAKYEHLELDLEQDGDDIQEALYKLTGQSTVPNIFIGKQHIGGSSDLQRYSKKDLEKLLQNAGALKA